MNSERTKRLLIIGAGELGSRVAARWTGPVEAETRTAVRHAGLRQAGAAPRLRDWPEPPPSAYVLFSVPPSSADANCGESYEEALARAVRLWDRSGMLVFTSSTTVYAEENGGVVDEGSPLAGTPRARRLIDAERIVIEAGGAVVRLAGLWDQHRGPHRYYARAGESERRSGGLVNLIHYDDAAGLCLAALQRGRAREVYLGCDGRPITRAEMVPACRFAGSDEEPIGRRCDCSRTMKSLNWLPRIPFSHGSPS